MSRMLSYVRTRCFGRCLFFGIFYALLHVLHVLSYVYVYVYAPSSFAENTPAPNVTVSFTLNSALDEQQTLYYTHAVRQLVAQLPRELPLSGEAKNLLQGANRDIKVITYLPGFGPDGTEAEEKDIRFFKVLLTLPEGEEIEQVAMVSKETGADMQQVPALSDDMEPTAHGNRVSPLPTPSLQAQQAIPEHPIEMGTISGKLLADDTTIEAEKIPEPPQTESQPMMRLTGNMGNIGNTNTNTDTDTPSKPALPAQSKSPANLVNLVNPEKPEKSDAPSTPTPTAKAPQAPEEKSTAQASQKTAPKKPAPKPKTRAVTHKVKASYAADGYFLPAEKRDAFVKLIRKAHTASSNAKKLFITTQSNWGPFGEMEYLGKERLKQLKALMREQGINPSEFNFIELHLRTTGTEQYMEVSAKG